MNGSRFPFRRPHPGKQQRQASPNTTVSHRPSCPATTRPNSNAASGSEPDRRASRAGCSREEAIAARRGSCEKAQGTINAPAGDAVLDGAAMGGGTTGNAAGVRRASGRAGPTEISPGTIYMVSTGGHDHRLHRGGRHQGDRLESCRRYRRWQSRCRNHGRHDRSYAVDKSLLASRNRRRHRRGRR